MLPYTTTRRFNSRSSALLLFVCAALGASCAATTAPPRGGTSDAAITDLGVFDAPRLDAPSIDMRIDAPIADGGVDLATDLPRTDIGVLDLGPPDLGPPDLGPPDLGPPDLGPPDMGACVYSCIVSIGGGTVTSDCASPTVTSRLSSGDRYVAGIDLTTYTELAVTLTACDPTAWVFQLADDAFANGYGGGVTTACAEINVIGADLYVYGNNTAMPPGSLQNQQSGFLAATGCSTRTILVRDSQILLPDSGQDWSSPYLLRLNLPGDSPGPADAIWNIALNQVEYPITASRVGTGAMTAHICIR